MKLYEVANTDTQALLKEMGVTEYEVTDRGIDTEQDVKIPQHYTSIPIQFNYVGGDFNCSYINITSLQGAPREVGGNFWCDNANITSLQHAPREVGGDFYCSDTDITSLQYAPREVGGDFVCDNTKITSLQGAPVEVGGDFDCSDTNIKGKPDASHINIGGELIWEQ